MTTVSDLHIEKEIVKLFDYTNNSFSAEALFEIFKKPLSSIEAIIERQQILKGILSNFKYLKKFAYSSADFSEVHQFLTNYSYKYSSGVSSRLHLIFSSKHKSYLRSRLFQLVLLFHKIQRTINTIDESVFPKSYKKDIQFIKGFLSDLNLDNYENKIREGQFRNADIVSLTKTISLKIEGGELETFFQYFYIFEAYCSISFAIDKHNFTFPVFSSNNFRLEQLYHPLLKQPVKNELEINSHVVLITGANMSGKSTLLKAIGLAVYFSHIGIAIAASKAEVPFFDSISVFINLNDNLSSGYSHFMTEIMHLKSVLQESKKGHKCFAIFDELFRGTNIDDAIEISTTTIKGLSKFDGYFIISTHLHQLYTLPEIKSNTIASYYIDCNLQNNIPFFTYQLKKGTSDFKLGKILFEKEGLNELFTST